MAKQSINWKIAGQAGGGVAISSAAFAKICMRHGLKVFEYGEYPSLIRGGHTSGQVYADRDSATCQQRLVDVMVALNEDAITQHLEEFSEETILLIDKKVTKLNWDSLFVKANIIDLPMHTISIEATGSSLADNMVAIGASCWILGLDLETSRTVIKESFARKGPEVVGKNIDALNHGYEYVKKNNIPHREPILVKQEKQIIVSGNEAIGMGALSAGVQFYASYPMTPTSSLLHFFAANQDKFPLVVKHAEDEISAINQAIGASFAGARAMVGTAGGGFALMVEAVSLAGVAETPLVVVEGQRPGPATGLPTWTCQADLQFVLHAGHGEFPKVVLAPGDMTESFLMSRLAFLIAEKFHTQVYLMGDKYLLESTQSVPRFQETFENTRFSFATQEQLPADGSYKRFVPTEEGYSARSVPGQSNGLQLTNSYEHDEHGYATEDAHMTKTMIDKRLRKFPGLLALTPPPQLMGPPTAEVTFVAWGSTKLVLTEVMKQVNAKSPNTVNVIHLSTMMPFHSEEFFKLAKQAKKLVMIEGNALGQCEALIREKTGITFDQRIHRYDGRPFYAEDILRWIAEFQRGGQA